MGESEEDQSSIQFILIVVLAAGIIFVILTLIAPLFPVGSSHPPQVLIWRESTPSIFPDDKIHIKYLGGTDDGFVGDFLVIATAEGSGNFLFSGDYAKPEAYSDVAVLDVPRDFNHLVCVNVSAIDLAVHTYRPIGYNCT